MVKRIFYQGLLALLLSISINPAHGQDADDSIDEPDYRNVTLADNESLPRSNLAEQANSEIKEVLKGKDFGEAKTVESWRWIDTKDAETRDEKIPEWLINLFDILDFNKDLIATISFIMEVLIWLIVAISVIFIIVRYRENLRHFFGAALSHDEEVELPATLMGIDLKKEALPTDIPAEAQTLWRQKEHRKALALLLKGSLIKLLRDYRVRLYDSDTESECCDRIDQQAPKTTSSYMRNLVGAWQSLAYAHVLPENSTFNTLCNEWPSVFANSQVAVEVNDAE